MSKNDYYYDFFNRLLTLLKTLFSNLEKCIKFIVNQHFLGSFHVKEIRVEKLNVKQF